MPQTEKSNSQRMTTKDLYRFKTVQDMQISPNGRQIICSVQETDSKSEKKYSNLWMFATGSRQKRQYTFGKQSNSKPRWSPDGRQIAFISNRDDDQQPQLYLLPVDGGEARPLTDLKGQIGALHWAADGKSLFFTFLKKGLDEIARDGDEQKKKLGVVARHITTTDYKYDGLGYLPAEKWHIWRVNARTGKSTQLTDGEHSEDSFAVGPDSQTIAFISNRSLAPDLTPDLDEIYTLPAPGENLRHIPTTIGPKFFVSFSPDGRWLAYLGSEGEGLWYQNISLWVVPVDASQPAHNLTAAFDLTAVNITGGDMGSDGLTQPVWSRDNQEIIFQASTKGDTALMAVTLDKIPQLRRVVDRPGTISHFSWDTAQEKMAYLFSDFNEATEVYLLDMQKQRTKALSRFNKSWLSRKEVGKIEEVQFKARDGYDLHGWVFFPPDFDPQEQYPSILEIHGGPQVQYGRAFMHEFHYLAANGYVVYFCNPRGGQGYGEGHCKAIYNNWGSVDFDDVMDWADYMKKRPYIDHRRMGVTGGSYGGYMTNLIIGRAPEYFQAAVTQRSVSNLISMWGSSDANWQFQQSIGNNKPPYANLAHYWHSSPMNYIENAKTPTLVIHSERDLRVAQEQGEQVFIALRQKGVETELLLFPEEPHGLSRAGRCDRRITRLQHILRWFDKYLNLEP